MNHLGLLAFTYVALVLDTCLRTPIAVGQATPHWLALVAVSAVLLIDGWPALFWAGLAGLLSDCLKPGTIGIDMFVATMVVFIVQRAMRGQRSHSVGSLMFLLFFMLFTFEFATTASRILVSPGEQSIVEILLSVAGVAAYSTILGLTFVVGGRLGKRLFPRIESRPTSSKAYSWKMLTD